ncbi:MAG: hypothetical protein GY754_09505 [bacterium]|nr:hypothetical protein [bacterium]
MKKSIIIIIAVFFCGISISGDLYSRTPRRLGRVGKINRAKKEIIVASPSAGRTMRMGKKVFVKVGNSVVVMRVTFPMVTIARCKVLPKYQGFLNRVRKNQSVYGYYKGVENQFKKTAKEGEGEAVSRKVPTRSGESSQDAILPLYGVTFGKTTVKELAQLGEKAKDINTRTKKVYDYYKVNNMNFWYNPRTGVSTSIYLVYYKPFPKPWVKLGFNWTMSFNEWKSFLKKRGYIVTVKKGPMVKMWQKHKSFEADLSAKKIIEGVEVKIELDFSYSKGTTVDDKKTIYSFRASSW